MDAFLILLVTGVTLLISFTMMHQIIDQLLKALKFQIVDNNCIRQYKKYVICLNVPTLCSNFEQKDYSHCTSFPKMYIILPP